MSENKNIYEAFINAQKEFEPALKNSTNPHFRSKYADLGACIDAIKDALNRHDIGLMQITHECDDGVAIETIFIHKSGECLKSGILRLPATKKDAQGYGSALTYARRYSLMAAVGIAPEDDDGEHATRSHNEHKKNYGLQGKIEEIKKHHNRKEELILQAEEKSAMGMRDLVSWWKSLSDTDHSLIKDEMPKFKEKCQSIEELNQDLNQ